MKIKRINVVCVLSAIVLLTSCSSQKKKDQTISISGAFALYPLVVQWADAYKTEHPDVRFNISGGGAGKGMADALAGAVDLGMFSREITKAELDKGVWFVGLTIDAVIPTINDQNPYLDPLKKRGLTRDEFRQIFITNKVTDWAELLQTDGELELVVYTRSDACGAAGTWAAYLDGVQEDLKGIGIFGDPGLAEAVLKDVAGIGFNNTIFAYDIHTGKKRPGIEIIPIDINENRVIEPEEYFYDTFDGILNAIANGVYPSPPARELYFVANGKPHKQATIDFIKWILTEGQKFVTEAGYVPVEQSKLDYYLEKLNN